MKKILWVLLAIQMYGQSYNLQYTGSKLDEALDRVYKMGRINVARSPFDCIGDGINDDSAELQEAIDSADAQSTTLYIPAGYNLKVSAKINFKGVSIIGDGPGVSIITTTIDNGDATLETDNTDRFLLKDFKINGGTVNLAGTASGSNGSSTFTISNAVGLQDSDYIDIVGITGGRKVTNISGTTITVNVPLDATVSNAAITRVRRTYGVKAISSSNRFMISNIYASNVATGFYIHGWIGEAQNIWAWNCGVGFYGDVFNGCRLQLMAENCAIGLRLEQSSGTGVTGTVETCGLGFLLCSEDRSEPTEGITLDHFYLENNSVNALLGTAPNDYCRALGIISGKWVGSGYTKFDRVDGVNLAQMGSFNNRIYFTSNTKNISPLFLQTLAIANVGYAEYLQSEQAGLFKKAENYFPNPFFRGSLRGFQQLYRTNLKYKIEDTLKFNQGGLRLYATTGTTSKLEFRLQNHIIPLVTGKTIKVGAWIYIPSISAFTQATPVKPDLTIWYKGSTDWTAGLESATSGGTTGNWTAGRWNYFVRELTLPDTGYTSNEAQLKVICYVNRSGASATGSPYVVIGQLAMVPDPASYSELINNNWSQFEKSGRYENFNDNWLCYEDDSTYASADFQTFQSGDILRNKTLSVGGIYQWVVTSSGTTGTLSVTGDISSGSPIVSNVSSTANINVGDYVTVGAGITRGKVISVTVNSFTVNVNSGATATGAAVSYTAPIFTVFTLN